MTFIIEFRLEDKLLQGGREGRQNMACWLQWLNLPKYQGRVVQSPVKLTQS